MVRRHVLGMKDDASPWAKLGRGLARLALYMLRAVVDLKGTRRGVKAAILAAAPLPETEAPPWTWMPWTACGPSWLADPGRGGHVRPVLHWPARIPA